MLTAPRLLIALGAIMAIWLPSSARAQAGPPFLSNDPGTPGNANWEINIASAQSISRAGAAYQVPQIDLNFGVGDRIQLTYEIPYVVEIPAGQPHQSGWSNSFTGVKWRFLDQRDGGWQASLFPQLEANGLASAQQKGIAMAGTRWLLPLEVTKRCGPVDVNVEAGYYLPAHGVRERILGVVVGRPVSERVDLAIEIYNDHAIGAPPNATTVDLGGRFKLGRGFVALFMAGRSVGGTANGPEFVGYVGIQILLSDYGRTLERTANPIEFRPAH